MANKKRKVVEASSSEESSSEEEESSSQSSSEEDSSSEESSSEDEEQEARRKSAPKAPAKKPVAKKPAPKKPAPKKQQEEDELEDAVVDADDPGYGSDLVKNDEDSAYLKSLSEMDREQVLSDRYEKRQTWKELVKLKGGQVPPKKKVAAPKRKAAPAPKKKLVAAHSDSEEEKPKPVAAPASSSSSSSSSESEQPSDNEDDEDLPKDYRLPIAHSLLDKIVVTRRQVLGWMDFPKFKSGMRGCIIKSKLEAHAHQYELLVVSDVVLAEESYVVDKERVVFVFKCGKQRVPLSRVSNQPVTQYEYEQYRHLPPLAGMLNSHAYKTLETLKSKLIEVRFTNKEVLLKVEAGKARRGDNSALSSKRFGANPVERKNMIKRELGELGEEKQRLVSEMNSHPGEVKLALDRLRKTSEQITLLDKELLEVEKQIQARVKRVFDNEAASKLNLANAERNAQALLDDKQPTSATASTSRFVRRPTRPQVMWDIAKGGASKPVEAEPVVAIDAAPQPVEVEHDEQEPEPQVVNTMSLVKPAQVFLRVIPGSHIVQSNATKRYTLEEYQQLRGRGRY